MPSLLNVQRSTKTRRFTCTFFSAYKRREIKIIQSPPPTAVLSTMVFVGRVTIALALAGTAFSASVTVQNPNIVLPSSAAANQAAVVQIFTESYNAYKFVELAQQFVILLLIYCQNFREFAFGHDDLSPLTQGKWKPVNFYYHSFDRLDFMNSGFSDGLGGWGNCLFTMLFFYEC